MAAPVTVQVTHRWVDDDGSLTAATLLGSGNGEDINFETGADNRIRIRFRIEETNGGNFVLNPTLYFSYNEGTYEDCGIATDHLRAIASKNTSWTVTDDDLITANRLGAGNGVWEDGHYDADGVADSGIGIKSEHTEVEYCIYLDGATLNTDDTIDLRVYDSGVALTTYTDTPRITVTVAAVTHTANAQLDGVGLIPAVAVVTHPGQVTLAGIGTITGTGKFEGDYNELRIDFEENDLTDFDSTIGAEDLAANTTAAMVGTYGMEYTMNDVSDHYGELGTSLSALTEDELRIRWYFDPNSVSYPDANDWYHMRFILDGSYSGITLLTRVRVGWNSGTGFFLLCQVKNDADSTLALTSTDFSDAEHYFEIYVKRESTDGAADGEFRAWIDETELAGAITNLENFNLFDPSTFDFFDIGGVGAIDATPSGSVFIDDIILRDAGSRIGAAGGALNSGANLAGVGTITALAKVTHQATSTLPGIGTLAAIGQRIIQALSSLDSVGTLTAVAQRIIQAQINLPGVGDLAGKAEVTHQAISQLDGVGTLTGDPAALLVSGSTLPGVATITGVGSTSAVHEGTASLAGIGLLPALATVLHAGTSLLDGAGTLVAQAEIVHQAISQLNGVGTLTADAQRIIQAQVDLPGIGDLAGKAEVTHQALLQINGVGTITAFPTKVTGEDAGAAVLPGVGTLAAIAEVTYSALSLLSGSGSLVAVGQRIIQAQLILDGVGTFTAVAQRIIQAQISLPGVGDLAGKAEVTHFAQVDLPGVGDLAGKAEVTHQAISQLDGIGTLAAVGSVSGAAEVTGSAQLDGIGIIILDGSIIFIGLLSLPGVGDIASIGSIIYSGISLFEGVATLSAIAQNLKQGSITFAGIGLVSSSGSMDRGGFVTMSSIATLISGGIITYGGASTLDGISNIIPAGTNIGGAATAFDILTARHQLAVLTKEDE